MVGISVVVPVFNRADVLRVTLEHLCRQDYPHDSFEVVVADDGSAEPVAQVVDEFTGRLAVRYVRQPNRGRAAACNLGARHARHEVLLILDSDIWAGPDTLAAHAGHHAAGDRVGVATLSQYHPSTRVNPFMEVKGLFPDLTRRQPQDLSPLHAIMQCFSVRARDLWAVGGFDEGFRTYGWEDFELAWRLRASGVRLRLEPRPRVWHYHVETLESARAKQRQAGAGAVYFWKKHGSPWGLGFFLEVHPLLLPLKWLVYRTSLFAPALRRLCRVAEARLELARGRQRRFWLLVAHECYVELLWHAYYEGVWEALRSGRHGPGAGED
ncbi:MAG: glycosyltransferase [Armatimonadota bacterium]|nr:glycosyltransferase [Armatimonadota bacterium]MDW8155865.1 glycosyltransferase [Armatimonadota bacterium]